MNKQPILIPEGAKVIDVSSFEISTYSYKDTLAERVVLDVKGHDVQIIRYDGDDNDSVVYIDERLTQVNIDDINVHINSNTK